MHGSRVDEGDLYSSHSALSALLDFETGDRTGGLGTQLTRYADALDRELGQKANRERDDEDDSIWRTARLGARADRAGLGLAIAYYEATRIGLGGARFASLAVTEPSGAHPRKLEAEAVATPGGYELSGTKSFVTLGGQSASILILAKERKEQTEPGGRAAFGLFCVDASHAQLERRALPETPFTPELPHIAIRFERLRLSEASRLPGDGYNDWVRNFVMAEEHHILAALYGYRLGLDRVYSLTPNQAIEAAFLKLLHLSRDTESHQSLALLIEAAALLREEGPLPIAQEESARYERDLKILELGAARRAKRFERLRAKDSFEN